jgi:HKD family nuclease
MTDDIITDLPTNIQIEPLKSWRTFQKQFSDAQRLKVVTFCDTPSLILNFFDEHDLDTMEVVVGDIGNYRERLVGKPDTADRLERLKREGDLRIYTCPNWDVHSKIYLIEPDDETVRIIIGSANLTKNGWGNQTNCAVIFEVPQGSQIHERVLDIYESHIDDYGDLFLDDLTEKLKDADDREETINLFVEGRVTTGDELGEIHGQLNEKLDTVADEVNLKVGEDDVDEEVLTDLDEEERRELTKINLSVQGFDTKTINSLESGLSEYDANFAGDNLSVTTPQYGRYMQEQHKLPKLWLSDDDDAVRFQPPNNVPIELTAEPESPEQVNEALAGIERYFQTVDDYGDYDDSTAVKAHMYEALLYFFWAPFINRRAAFYRQHGLDLDKNLPYLYIYGESNSGKGTFCEFAVSLLSYNFATGTIDADTVGKPELRAMRSYGTSFPAAIDDITSSQMNNLDETLRNYWSEWDGSRTYPAFVFISNDNKPASWFRNRAKILHFDVLFTEGRAGASEANAIIEEDNPLFAWFAHEYLQREPDDSLPDDVLYETREVFKDLYSYADRPLPEYFPTSKAERVYDIGKQRWLRAHETDCFELTEEEDDLVATFTEDMKYQVHSYRRDLPNDIRASRRGRSIVIGNPDRFQEWLGITPETSSSGFWARLTGRVRG